MNQRAVFLDRDGVINEIVDRDGQPGSPRHPGELVMTQGVDDCVQRLRREGFRAFIITNQPEVARGTLEGAQLAALMALVRAQCTVDDVRICPHDDVHACECRKPKPGMITSLARQWSIDLGQSFVIGDSRRDMDAGRAAGCLTLLIDRPYNAGVDADVHVVSLATAVSEVLKRSGSELNDSR
jgi:D-glycero-D-manno-heptose 1,7-bisphosphate phosphatase